MSGMIRFDEKAYAELLAKRAGWKPGAVIEPSKPAPKSLEVDRKQSDIEIMLAEQIHLLQLPVPKRNYLFMPGRRLELDFAWPERLIALEVQGMVHRIAERFKADIEKRALALLAGWRILEVGGQEIRSGQASRWLEELLKEKS